MLLGPKNGSLGLGQVWQISRQLHVQSCILSLVESGS